MPPEQINKKADHFDLARIFGEFLQEGAEKHAGSRHRDSSKPASAAIGFEESGDRGSRVSLVLDYTGSIRLISFVWWA